MGCSPLCSSVHGISQARILEWVAISFFRGSSWLRYWTWILLHCRQMLYWLSCQGRPPTPYIYGFANGLAQAILMLCLSFCGPNEINHFYCENQPLFVLSWSDTYVNETAMFMVAGSNLLYSPTIIFISYIFIFPVVVQIRMAEDTRPSPPVDPTWQLSVTVFMGRCSACIWDPLLRHLPVQYF